MMSNEGLQELEDRIITNLYSVSDEKMWDVAASVKDFGECFSMYSELVFDVATRSHFKTLRGDIYFFNGYIYVPVQDELLYHAFEGFLKKMRVRSKILFYSSRKLTWKFKDALRLNSRLSPSYCIHAFLNGVVDFRECILRDFSPEYHVTFIHNYRYNPKAKCPMWNEFIRDVLDEPESRLILQMFLGLCTYDRGFMVNKVENCLVMYGQGSNGKSVIHEVVRGVMGEDNVSHMGLKPLTRGGDEQLRNMAEIEGKLINLGSELDRKDIMGHEDSFKSICSGERQYARKLGKDVYRIDNVPWMVFNTNNLLKLEDTSYGVMRRIIWLVFDKTIRIEDQNTQLASDLVAEYPGIMNWIIEGGRKLRKNNYKFPISPKSLSLSYREEGENNSVRSWVRARGIRFKPVKEEKWLDELFSLKELYDDLIRYSEYNGFATKITARALSSELQNISGGQVKKTRRADGMYYKLWGITHEDMRHDVSAMIDNHASDKESIMELYDDLL